MYLDTRGHVTTGIGHLLKNADEAMKLPWRHKSTGLPATPDEIRSTFERLREMGAEHRTGHPKGSNRYGAGYYEDKSDLVLPEGFARKLALGRLQGEFLTNLKRIFPGFERYPMPAQRALVDMAYNLGVGKLEHKFPKLVGACRLGDFETAAKESRRSSSRQERNEATRDLFIAAANLKASVRTLAREVRP